MTELDLLSELKQELAKVLGIHPSSIDSEDKLLELGLHSLNAVELRQKISLRYGVDMSLSEFFVKDRTLEQLASLLASLFGKGTSEFFVVWDPEAISPELYAEFVEALGDLVRANGGAGIVRSRSHPILVKSSVGVRV